MNRARIRENELLRPRTCEETLEMALREMRSQEGGFYSDARPDSRA